jgi:hypothetical protein
MTMRIAMAAILSSWVFLLWKLIQNDLGVPGLPGRGSIVLAMTGCTFLAIATAFALLPNRRRRSAILVVRNGVIRRGESALPGLDRGRAVSVVVQEGHVAVLERLGRYARSLGPGVGRLHPGETIHKVILTSPRPLIGTVDCSTRDSVPVTADFELEARILPARGEAPSRRPSPHIPGQAAGRAPTRGFEWSHDAVVRASWELATLNAARGALRGELANASLDELFDLNERHREALPFSVVADRVRIELNEQCRAWGGEVLRFQLLRIKIPALTEQSILANWRTRHQLPSVPDPPADEQTDSETLPSEQETEERGATLRLAPVLSRGLAASLREAIRQRLGYLTTDGVEIGGERYMIQPARDSAGDELSLRPGAAYFALAVQGDNLARCGAVEGDFVLFESQSHASDGSLVATLIGGDLRIKRLSRRPAHSLLEPDTSGQPSVILTESDAQRDELFAQYATCLPPVEYWPADDARVLGGAVMIFRPLSSEKRPSDGEQTWAQASAAGEDFPNLATAPGEPDDRPARGETPGDPPPSLGASVPSAE